jgi:leucyl-tRNA synthetase
VYDFLAVERKWQAFWEREQTFRTPENVDTNRPKYYILDMFPYPSGAGLHVGHPEGYTATDILARYKRMRGFNVLHPMGWDAFGLPAEQFALDTGTHPAAATERNIQRFRRQLQSLGFSYDWQREVNTTSPEYYRWTQWIFLQLYKKGLAYQAEIPVNWCPALGTVLANEEVIDGRSERGGHPVVRKPMRQWVLRITAYAERLLQDLELLDWPENVKEMQRNWIGKSEGVELRFPVGPIASPGNEATALPLQEITVFTTRPETITGVTYLVLAPEFPDLDQFASDPQREYVLRYVEQALQRSDRERLGAESKLKTGVFTGRFAVHPLTGEQIPIWVADYVLGGYGTGAIMAVPGHDARDRAFAEAFQLPIRTVIDEAAGQMVGWNSTWLNGLDLDGVAFEEARIRITEALERLGIGRRKINYKLRDWLFSRQRYWGEPFPIIFDADTGEPHPVDEHALPVELPQTEAIRPSGDGRSPLANIRDWVELRDPTTGQVRYLRETNTMPQWAGSCWYYLRFIDNRNTEQPVDPEKERYWMPVDLYVGGVEHAVLHLLYARFWHKVLYDLGVVSTPEPFQRLVNQGMILGEVEYTYRRRKQQDAHSNNQECAHGNGRAVTEEYEEVRVPADQVEKVASDRYVLRADPKIEVSARAHKMSKSRGNVVNPDEIVQQYGADALRCYLMFMGPLDQVKPWSTQSVNGMRRFLDRAWRLVCDGDPVAERHVPPTREQLRLVHTLIKRVTEDTEALRFNTAIAAMMEFLNEANKWKTPWPRARLLSPFVLILSPYAPHVAEEMWQEIRKRTLIDNREENIESLPPRSLAYEPWPTYDPQYLARDTVTYAVQVNGKVRGTLQIDADADRDTVLAAARQVGTVASHLHGKRIVREVFVSGKITNFVVQ